MTFKVEHLTDLNKNQNGLRVLSQETCWVLLVKKTCGEKYRDMVL
jgi:hypothetical protein